MAKKTIKGNKKEPKENLIVEPKGVKKDVIVPTFVFNRENYILLGVGLALIVIGFLLMMGGGSDDPTQFSEELFSFRRITLAPILILAGYVVEVFAIMKKFNK